MQIGRTTRIGVKGRDQLLRAQKELVKVTRILRPVLNYKGV